MKKYALAIALILIAVCAFADDRVLVVNPTVEATMTDTEVTFVYSGNIENFSDKAALTVIRCCLVDEDMNVLDSRALPAAMEPNSRGRFSVAFTFPLEAFLDPVCTGVLCMVEYSYPGGYSI